MELDTAQVGLPAAVHCYLREELVGKMALLAAPAAGVTHSTIPLDRVLSDAGLDWTDEDAVTDYLAEALRVEVKKVSTYACFARRWMPSPPFYASHKVLGSFDFVQHQSEEGGPMRKSPPRRNTRVLSDRSRGRRLQVNYTVLSHPQSRKAQRHARSSLQRTNK